MLFFNFGSVFTRGGKLVKTSGCLRKHGGSNLEEVGSLRDQRRVQLRFGPDVVGILQKLLPLWRNGGGKKET